MFAQPFPKTIFEIELLEDGSQITKTTLVIDKTQPLTQSHTATLKKALIARAEQGVVIGCLVLTRNQLVDTLPLNASKLHAGHVLAFYADSSQVFFMDSQHFNGHTQQGEPAFDDILEKYAFANNSDKSNPHIYRFLENVHFIVTDSFVLSNTCLREQNSSRFSHFLLFSAAQQQTSPFLMSSAAAAMEDTPAPQGPSSIPAHMGPQKNAPGMPSEQQKRGGNITHELLARYQLLAAQGYAPAQCNLGDCFEMGVGVAPNAQTAIKYYHLAFQSGEVNANTYLIELLKNTENHKFYIELIQQNEREKIAKMLAKTV